MTEELFRRDNYAFEFESRIASVEGDDVELDVTAFYPGGGGQVCDTGTIRDNIVTEVFYKNDRILHKVPGNDFKEGDIVWCSVDWERRYDLMMGHTGEHLLFCSLRRQVPELSINKIFISPESKYLIVDRDIDWDDIRSAVVFANQAIRDNLPVTKTIMDREDPDIDRIRIKKDRIPEGEEISVVSIGDIDLSACSGLHVMETSELEMILVDKKSSAGKDGTAIHFKIGNGAKDAAIDLASICLMASDAIESKPEDLTKAVSKMRCETAMLKKSVNNYVKKQIMALVPTTIGGIDIVGGIFPPVDRSVLSDAADAYKDCGKICILISSGDVASVIISSGTNRIDCKDVLSKVLRDLGGKGGGGSDFAQGGVADPLMSEEIFMRMKEEVVSRLN